MTTVKDARNTEILEKQRHLFSNPIYSSKPGGWQMDTVFPSKVDMDNGSNSLLWFQNVNTKQIHTVKLEKAKDAQEVEAALRQFKEWANKHNQPVNSITADKDPAYTDPLVLDWYTKNKVNFTSTKNHSALGVINRGIRTIRKQVKNNVDKKKRTFNADNVNAKVEEYNDTLPHFFQEGHSPNQMARNRDLELSYIAGKMNEADRRREKAWEDYKYFVNVGDEKKEKTIQAPKVGDWVRRFDDRRKWEHGASYLYKQKFKVHGIDKLRGKVYLGTNNPADGLIEAPRYQVIKNKNLTEGDNFQKIDTNELKKKVANITGYKNNKYEVVYDNGDTGSITERQLRGNRPNNPLRMELEYWQNKASTENTHHMETRSKARDKNKTTGVFENLPAWLKEHLPDDFKQTPKVELKSK
jgi:hypothetical protein